MDYQQQVHQALDSSYRCLQERYRQTMEEHLRAVEEQHCLEIKQTQDRLQEEQRCRYRQLEEQSFWENEQRYRETQEQERSLDEQYQQYRQSQDQAMEKQYRRLQQQQDRAMEEQYKKCKGMRDRALEEKYRCYRKQRDRSSEDQYRRDVEELHCIKEGMCQGGMAVSGWSRQGQLLYRVEEQKQRTCLAKKGQQPQAMETPPHSTREQHPQDLCGQNQPTYQQQPKSTEPLEAQSAEAHPGYYADDESSSDCRSSAPESSEADLQKTSPTTGDSLSLGSTSHPRAPPNSPRSSGCHTDVSEINQDMVKGQLPKESTNWLTSFLIDYMQTIYNQFRSSDMPEMADEQHRNHFMAFLEKEKVFEALQEVADKAVSKLTLGCTSRVLDGTLFDSSSKSSFSSQRSGHSRVSPGSANTRATVFSSSSTVYNPNDSQRCSPTSSLDREATKSSVSLDGNLYKMESQTPKGFWDQAPLQVSKQENIPPCGAKSSFSINDDVCSTSTQKSSLMSSDKSEWGSSGLPELLFIGSVSGKSDAISEKSSSPCSVYSSHPCSDRTNTTSPDSHVCSSSGRYTQFLEFLEENMVFSALQDVVDKATNYLVKPEMKKKSSSMFMSPDSSSFQIFNPNSQVLMVTSGHKLEPSITQIYYAKTHPPDLGQQPPEVPGPISPQVPTPEPPQVAGPNTPQVPTAEPPQVPGQTSPQVPTPESPQVPEPQSLQGPGLQAPEPGPQPSLMPEQQPSQQSPYSTGPSDRTSMTSHFISPAPISTNATTPSTIRREMEQTSTSQSSRTSSTVKTKHSSSRSHVSANTPKLKPTTSILGPKAHQKKVSDAALHKRALQENNPVTRWVSVPRKLRSDSTKASCTTKPRKAGACKFTNEEIMECLIESALALMVHKRKTERRLTSKIGFVAQPIMELYNEQMAKLRWPNHTFQWPFFVQSLSIHEEHCLASHPLWAGMKTTNRFHLAWESKVRRRQDGASSPSSDTSCQQESSTLPDINIMASPKSSLFSGYSQDLSSTRSPSLTSSKMPFVGFRKL